MAKKLDVTEFLRFYNLREGGGGKIFPAQQIGFPSPLKTWLLSTPPWGEETEATD